LQPFERGGRPAAVDLRIAGGGADVAVAKLFGDHGDIAAGRG
jgi:hypothetical protein